MTSRRRHGAPDGGDGSARSITLIERDPTPETLASLLSEAARLPVHRVGAGDETGTVRLPEATTAVVCWGLPGSPDDAELVRASRRRGIALVAVEPARGQAGIGPLVGGRPRGGRSGEPGASCPVCARLHRVREPGAGASSAHGLHAGLVELTALLTLAALDPALGHLLEAGRRYVPGSAPGSVRVEPVPRHHACPACFPSLRLGTGTETAEAERPLRRAPILGGRAEAERRWREARQADRDRDPIELGILRQRLSPFVGGEHGLFESVLHTSSAARRAVWRFFRARGVDPAASPLASAHHALAVRRVSGEPIAAGEALDFGEPEAAEALALAEGLERTFTMSYVHPGDVVEASYDDVHTVAVDPTALPLCAPEQHAAGSVDLERYDPAEPLRWLWGIRFESGEGVLVPLDWIATSSAPRIFRATSNGASFHSTLRHAVVNGIYELIERDALMLAWLQRLTLPRADMAGADRFGAGEALRALSFHAEYVDLTTDLGVPVVLAALRDAENPDFLMLNMVGSLDAEALRDKLARELSQFTWHYLIDRDHFRTEASRADTFEAVREMPDHLCFYQDRARLDEVAFLWGAEERVGFGTSPWFSPGLDADSELDVLSRRVAEAGYEVVVVDTTPPLLQQLGLHVVKVVIPGLLPLTAGHRNRVLGGRRVFEAPARMGLSARARTPSELNVWPHPFW